MYWKSGCIKSRDAPTAGASLLFFHEIRYNSENHSFLTLHGIVQSRCPEFLVYGHQSRWWSVLHQVLCRNGKHQHMDWYLPVRIGYRLYYTPDIFRFQWAASKSDGYRIRNPSRNKTHFYGEHILKNNPGVHRSQKYHTVFLCVPEIP